MPFRHMRAKGGATFGRWLRNAVSQLVPRSSSSASSGSVTGTDKAILEKPTLLQQQHQQHPPPPPHQQKQRSLPSSPCAAQSLRVTRENHKIEASYTHQYWHDRTAMRMQRLPKLTAALPKPSIQALTASSIENKLPKSLPQSKLSTLRKLESVPESSAEETIEHVEYHIRQGDKKKMGKCSNEPMSNDSGATSGSTASSSQLSSSDSVLWSSTIQRRRQLKDWSHREEVCRSISYHCPFLYDHYLDDAESDEEASSTLTLMHDAMEGTEWPDEPLEFPIGEGGPKPGPGPPLIDLPSPSRHSAASTSASSSDHTALASPSSSSENERSETKIRKQKGQSVEHQNVSLETIDDVFSHAVASFPLPPQP